MAKNKSSKPSSAQVQQKSIQQITQSFSGPLPPPAALQEYERISPGLAERIVSMAESQARHRQQLERSVIDSGIKDSRLGLWFGLVIGLVAVIGE